MDTVDLAIQAANTFYNQLQTDQNARFRSWEHCYKCFHDARLDALMDRDHLCLQLAFYLASWGMYRGSSFLLQKDYRVHTCVVEELLKPEYDCLFGLECKELRKKEIQDKLTYLGNNMKDHYDKIRKDVKPDGVKNELSDTLITKILIGTLGCVPAYDRYFIKGVKRLKITTGTYNIKSLLKLVDFYEDNRERFEIFRRRLLVYGLPYPQMKVIDMAFWEIGIESEKNKKS